jgi:2-keto-4-pentenoate hydratase/2-oxohepta-3-ene-1,7-dioic acid hydratase in catechol pathway
MRIATYQGSTGPRTAAVVGTDGAEQLIDLHDATGGAVPQGDLLALLESPGALEAAKGVTGGAGVPIGSVELLAPMARPPKLLAAAGNYQAHIVEGGAAPVDKSNKVAKLFLKPSTSVAAPGATIPMPTTSRTMDWELELGVIIGKRGRNIPVERALEYVAAYTVINDVSARTAEWNLPAERNPSDWDLFFDWLNGKWPDGFAPTGPWVVTADEIPDPQALRLTLKVNGETKQDATTEDMIWGCAELIAFASRFMTLEPGDTIATGTPSGVGDASGTYLAVGDVMEGWIEGIGTLITPVGPSVTETI